MKRWQHHLLRIAFHPLGLLALAVLVIALAGWIDARQYDACMSDCRDAGDSFADCRRACDPLGLTCHP